MRNLTGNHARTALCAALLLTASTVRASLPERFTVDGSRSDVTATVSFFGLASKTAEFPHVAGSIALEPARPDQIDLDVTLDATSIKAGDTVTTSRLRGSNFFDADHHPTVRFAGSHMRRTGSATALVDGQLTARGVTRPVALAVTFSKPIDAIRPGDAIEIKGETEINRKDFGMTAYSFIVGREVKIAIRTRMVPE